MPKKIIKNVVVSLILFSFFSVMFSVVVPADDDTVVVWVMTDTHVNDGNQDFQLEDALSDAYNESFGFDIVLVLGDMVNTIGDGGSELWDDELQEFRDIINASHFDYWNFYPICGNHEVQSVNNWSGTGGWNTLYSILDYTNDFSRPYAIDNVSNENLSYTITIGNVLFILFGPDYDCGNPSSNTYENQYDWWESLVENNTDKNIICGTHHALYGSSLTASTSQPWIDSGVSDYYTWVTTHASEHTIASWMCGHKHYGSTDVRESEAYNIDYQRLSAVDDTHAGEERHSYLLTFTNGSNTVTVADYFHDIDSWDGSGTPGNFSFTLPFAFSTTGASSNPDSISFYSINGQTNNTFVVSANRYFNWSRVDGATRYQLQISNSSSFSTSFLSLSDINESNYGVNYTELGDYIEFILPYSYNISWYGSHYYRVRAFSPG